jgi:hypothetical protein
MKRYLVNWIQRALNQVAAIWTVAVDRDAITAASAAIDARLQTDPDRKGSPHGARFRVLRVPPLIV